MVLRVGPRGSVLTETPVLPSSENRVERRWQVALEPSRRRARRRGADHPRAGGAQLARALPDARASARIATGASGAGGSRARGSTSVDDAGHRGSQRAGHGARGRDGAAPGARRRAAGGAGAAGHRARRRLRPHVRAPVGAAAGAGARLSVAARRGADAIGCRRAGGSRPGAPPARRIVDGPVRALLAGGGARRRGAARALVAERHAGAHQRRRLPALPGVLDGGRRRAGQPDRRVAAGGRWDR